MTKKISVSGWKAGFQKIRFTSMMRREFGYGLAKTKGTTDAVVNHERVELQVKDAQCDRIMAELNRLGAECKVEDQF